MTPYDITYSLLSSHVVFFTMYSPNAMLISVVLSLGIFSTVVVARSPLIAYTGQPVELSASGLQSIEANNAAKYAAEQILDKRLRELNLPQCVAVNPQILLGSSRVVAGLEYNLQLRLVYRPLKNQACQNMQNIIGQFQTEECQVVVVYQPYKPTKNAIMALLRHNCEEDTAFFPEANQ